MHRGIWEGFRRLEKERRTKVKNNSIFRKGEKRQALGEYLSCCRPRTVCRETAPHLMIGTEPSAGMLWLLVITVVSRVRVEFGKEGQKEEVEEEEEDDLWTLDTE
ncbi:hypothetical protein BDV34DRAFT_215910 [Aspergillus parasiticus]|uniref:Uncharacterized protein n=1 Tax=Aspergillus parasiticus TaxID=5067 RepID=A0A5N6DAJ5_ASPPA|nr:hypothetical protein BDV34DRAFT_215910 [Aspergillus parasiticus]